MKILLVDDHALFRDGLRHVLGHLTAEAVILEAANGREATDIADQHPDLDLILLDLMLPDVAGFEMLASLRARHPDVPVVVLSASENPNDIMAAIERGARGYIPKSSSSQLLFSALRLVFDGAVYVPPAVFVQPTPAAGSRNGPTVQELWSAAPIHPAPAAVDLTQRQLEVLKLIVQGKANKQIARELGIEESTVKAHIGPVLRALKVTSRVQAVLVVARLGIKLDALHLERPN